MSKISLPSGPGSIEGLGDSFAPQLNSGTSAYSVKIAIPPGVNGLQPEVVLSYNAGSGNGPFGLAWGYEPMSIQRETQKGLPTYGASDVLMFQGEELVPLSDGSYRMKNESSFMRVTRSGDGWQVQDKKGAVYLLGTGPGSRIMNPAGTTFTNTFKWLVNQVQDTHGNLIQYHYSTYPDSTNQLYCTEIDYSIFGDNSQSVVFDYEPRPDAFSGYLSGFEVKMARRCDEIRVLSNGGLVRRYELGYEVDTNSVIEPVSATDAGLSFSLLRRVTQFDNGTISNQQSAIGNYLPPLQFAYTRFDATIGVHGYVSNQPPYSLGNANMALADINCDSLPDLLYTDPLTGQHSVYYNLGSPQSAISNRQSAISFASATPFASYPINLTLSDPGTQLADFDGDGKVDLVQKTGDPTYGRFVYYPNTTPPTGNDEAHPSWGAVQSFPTPFPPVTFDDPSARTLDLNGDKRMDFMRTTLYGFVYFYNYTNGWQQDGLHPFGDPAMGDITGADNVQFSVTGPDGTPVANKLVQLADMNGDRLLDLVRLTVFGTRLQVIFWPNKGWGAWGNRVVMSGTIDLGVIPVDDVFVMDINGDGLADIVAVGYNYVLYWINQGNGSFSPMFTRTGMPTYQRGVTVLRQADINGNGSTDFIWENWDPVARGYRTEFYDFLGAAKPNLLSVIDNGVGLRTSIEYKTTTDYYVAARQAGHPWHTRLPFPSEAVSKITKSTGLDLDSIPGPDQYITEFSYYDGYYDSFMKEFRGFAFAKEIDRGDDNPSLNPQPSTLNSPSTITRFEFHTGTPDGIDYSGYGGANVFDPLSGWPQEPLKGRVLWTEVTLPTADFGGSWPAQTDGQMADNSVVFTRDINNWRIKIIHNPTNGFVYTDAYGNVQPGLSLPYVTADGKRVQFAFVANSTKQVYEANGSLAGKDAFTPVRPSKQTYIETDTDYFGNTIAERNYGLGSPGAANQDQRFTYITYAFNVGTWIIGLPASHRITDKNGVFVAEARNYYDGADFTGLPLGQVGPLGDMTREEHLINGVDSVPTFGVISTQVGDPRLPVNASINASRNRYDSFGNLVETRDPLYVSADAGHSKEYAYDPVFHTYVEQETIHVGNGNADLVARASYDYGAGAMLAATDFNDQVTSFLYDSFWRLVGIVKPGDSVAFPTSTFAYTPGDSFRHLYYHYDSAGNLTLVNTADASVVSSVATHQRTQAGTANTYDTISFTDGLGQKLGTLEENVVPGQWIAKDFKLYSSKGQERRAFLPFVVAGAAYQVPAESFANMQSFYDSPGRVVRTVNPPETAAAGAPQTETRTVHLPFETILYDEEQANPNSTRFGAYHGQLEDGLGRLVAVIEASHLNDDSTTGGAINQWSTAYEYDLNDNLTHITDSQNNQKWFRYDGLKRKLFMNDPDQGTMTYTYDDGSNLGQTVDAKGQQIQYTYDGVNRLLTERYLDGLPLPPWLTNSIGNQQSAIGNVIYHYDTPAGPIDIGDGTTATPQNTKGRVAWVQDLSGEEHTSYDARGPVAFVVKRIPDPISGQLVSYRTGFGYDSLDRVTTLTYADDDQVSYVYSARNLLQQIIGGPNGTVISNVLYQPSGQWQQIDYGNGVRTTYGYDPRLRLSSIVTRQSAIGNEVISFTYDFDGASNIKDILDNRPLSVVAAGDPRRNTQLFAYDDLYRITYAGYGFGGPGATNVDGGSISYRYDRIGNMLAQTSGMTNLDNLHGLPVANLGTMSFGGASGASSRVGRQAADPPGPHALSSIENRQSQIENRQYTYDANGNMTVIDGLTNTWDFKDRLVSIESANMRAVYTYDFTDRRISKLVFTKTNGIAPPAPTLTTLYADKFFEVRENDTPTKYVWNGATRVARMTGSSTNSTLVQLLRLYPGQNLVSLTVTATNFLSQLSSSCSQSIQAYVWNSSIGNWQLAIGNLTLPAGTVLWLSASTNAMLAIVGTAAPTPNAAIPAGASFQPAAVLSVNSPPADTLVASFDPVAKTWQTRFPAPLQDQSSPSKAFAPSEAVFVRAGSPVPLTTNSLVSAIRYYHQDHLGSSSVLTDGTGSACEEIAYLPFGQPRNDLESAGIRENYLFTEKEMDAESGLNYFEVRFQAPTLGRFASADPLAKSLPVSWLSDPQRSGLYAYGRSNPLRYRDPSGSEFQDALAKAFRRFVHVLRGPGATTVDRNTRLLDQEVKQELVNFKGSKAVEKVLTEDLMVSRRFGGKTGAIGRYFTTRGFDSPEATKEGLAILNRWGNSADQEAHFIIPKGTILYEGPAASQLDRAKQEFRPGEQTQIFVRGEDLKNIRAVDRPNQATHPLDR